MVGLVGRLAIVGLMASACGTSGGTLSLDAPNTIEFDELAPETTQPAQAESEGSETTSSQNEEPVVLPEPRSAPGVVVFEGVALPVLRELEGEVIVATPCGAEALAVSSDRRQALVMLDPGGDFHPDSEGGSVPVERAVELAGSVQQLLEADGIEALLTRDASDVAVATRRLAVESSGARVAVSFALSFDDSGSLEFVHPAADESGRRLAGLVHQRVALVPRDGENSPVDADTAVRAVLNQRGTDLFAFLRESSEAARVVVHMPIDQNGAVEDTTGLASALADAIRRYLSSDEQGDGFAVPEEEVRSAEVIRSSGECVDPEGLEAYPDPDDGASDDTVRTE